MKEGIYMNATDVKCPACGTVNHKVNLEETGGWMECITCGLTVKSLLDTTKVVTLPVFNMSDGKKLLRLIDG